MRKLGGLFRTQPTETLYTSLVQAYLAERRAFLGWLSVADAPAGVYRDAQLHKSASGLPLYRLLMCKGCSYTDSIGRSQFTILFEPSDPPALVTRVKELAT